MRVRASITLCSGNYGQRHSVRHMPRLGHNIFEHISICEYPAIQSIRAEREHERELRQVRKYAHKYVQLLVSIMRVERFA